MARHYIRFKTMVAMCTTPSPAGLPELLMTIAQSAECSAIKLRRSEKKPLNAINKGGSAENGKVHAIRFCVPDPHKPQKTKERISSGPEKIFIMVSSTMCVLATSRCFTAILLGSGCAWYVTLLQAKHVMCNRAWHLQSWHLWIHA